MDKEQIDLFLKLHQEAVNGADNELFGRAWDLPDQLYFDSPALSSHGLMDLLRSPAHFYCKNILKTGTATEAMVRGRILHTAVLEPKRFRENYRVAPAAPRNTKIGKDLHAKFHAGIKPNNIVLSQDHAEQVIQMLGVLSRSSTAWNMVTAGQSEMSVWWRNADGILCKARFDKLYLEHGILLDYKTTKDATLDGFRSAIYKYKYDMQMYWYMTGASTVFKKPFNKYIFLCQEPEAPYACRPFTANDTIFELGRKRVGIAYKRYLECLKREWDLKQSGKKYEWYDVWTAYPEEAEDIDIPFWAMKEIEVDDEAS